MNRFGAFAVHLGRAADGGAEAKETLAQDPESNLADYPVHDTNVSLPPAAAYSG